MCLLIILMQLLTNRKFYRGRLDRHRQDLFCRKVLQKELFITVIDRNSYNNMIIFDQTYTIEELLRNALSDADMAEFADEMVDKSMKKLTGDFKKVL